MTNDAHSDDPTISDEAELWRRIPPWHFVRDENTQRVRPSSAAFDDHPDGSPMSVLIAEEAGAPNPVLANYEGFALASITAGLARMCKQGVARDPTPNEPAHALLFGKKSNSVRKQLAKQSHWVIAPPNS